MDPTRIDRLARSLSAASSRRRALAATLWSALEILGLADAEARRTSGRCKRKPGECETCKKGKCERKHGKKRCKAGTITPTAEGTACSLGACQSGRCVAAVSTPCPLCGACGSAGNCHCVPSRTDPAVIRCVGDCPFNGCTGDAQCLAALGPGYVCVDFDGGACKPSPIGSTACCVPCVA